MADETKDQSISLIGGSEGKLVRPGLWLSMTGDVYTLRLARAGVLEAYIHSEEQGQEEEEPQSSFTITVNDKRELTSQDAPDALSSGLLIGDQIYWKGDLWNQCDAEKLTQGDAVLVLSEGEWHDGIFEAEAKNGMCSLTVMGKDKEEDISWEAVPRHAIRKIAATKMAKARLIKDYIMYVSDQFFDLQALYIFCVHRQYRYLGLNVCGLVIGMALSTWKLGLSDLKEVRAMIIGEKFFGEFKKSYSRGYRTRAFTVMKGAESGVEGLVSLCVQLFAVLYSIDYTSTQLILIGCSVATSIYGVANNTVDIIDLTFVRNLVNPNDRDSFEIEFQGHIFFAKIFKFVDVTSRICVVDLFACAFRPYGFFLWVGAEFVSVFAVYVGAFRTIVRCGVVEAFARACPMAVFPLSWISPPVAILDCTEERPAWLLPRVYVLKTLIGIAMFAAIAVWRPTFLEEKLQKPSHSIIVVTGIGGTLLTWALFVPLAVVRSDPRLKHKLPRVSGKKIGPASKMPKTNESSQRSLCCA